MDTRKIKHQYQISKWTPIIKECHASGMTVKAWCLENKVNEKQFFYWQRKIREEICASVETTVKEQPTVFVPFQIQDYDKKSSQSVPFSPDLVISIGDYRLELGNQTSPELLETVLKVIRHV